MCIRHAQREYCIGQGKGGEGEGAGQRQDVERDREGRGRALEVICACDKLGMGAVCSWTCTCSHSWTCTCRPGRGGQTGKGIREALSGYKQGARSGQATNDYRYRYCW